MIGKVTRGSDIRGLVRYLAGPGRSEEHTNARVVGASSGLGSFVGTGSVDVDELVENLDAPRKVFGTEISGGHVWHLSLTNAADDRELSDAEWGSAVESVMDRMGFDASPDVGVQWAAIRHGDSVAGNGHVHVAVSLIRTDGTAASTWNDFRKVSEACGALEERFGLAVVDGRTAGAAPALSRAELERSERTGVTPERHVLAQHVRAAAARSRSEAEFVTNLRSSGVLVSCRHHPDPGCGPSGFRVAVKPAAGEKPVWFGGGRLGRDLTLPALRNAYGWDPDRDAWNTRSRTVASAVQPTPQQWAATRTHLDAELTALQRIPVANRAEWAAAAHRTAGLLAAAAAQLEGDRSGDLTRAARQLSRSAQLRGHPPSGVPTAMRGVAQILARSSPTSANWTAVVRDVLRAAAAVQRAHHARAELKRARELAAGATTAVRTLERRAHSTQQRPGRQPARHRQRGSGFER